MWYNRITTQKPNTKFPYGSPFCFLQKCRLLLLASVGILEGFCVVANGSRVFCARLRLRTFLFGGDDYDLNHGSESQNLFATTQKLIFERKMKMEEKILVKGRKYRNYLSIIMCCLGIIGLVVSLMFSNGEFDIEFVLVLYGITVVFLATGIIFYLCYSKTELVVTEARVCGVAAFGKRVDLPLDSISAVGTSFLCGIDVGTSSGKIKFKLIENNSEVYKVLSGLILNRQRNNMPQSNNSQTESADELKKYKDLLDSGVITQEEFDAKKKQLLGL